jgi:hypothetical protein
VRTSRAGDMDARRAAFGGGSVGLYYLIHTNKVPKPVSGLRWGLSGRGKKHMKGGSDEATRP